MTKTYVSSWRARPIWKYSVNTPGRSSPEQIEALYEQLIDEQIDNAWTSIIQAREQVEDADLSCRFRTQPHLL